MSEKLWKAVLERIESNWQREVEFLGDLVAEPSLRGQEAGVQGRIADHLREMGLEPELWQLDIEQIRSHPGFSPPEWGYEGRPNLSASLTGTGGGRSLVLNGHVDVVPATPHHHWSEHPWRGTISNGRMYGRGAADMKSGVAAMIYAVRALREAGVRLRGDLVIDTVIEEECTGNGTLAALARRGGADAAIIPEPFNQTLMLAQVGVLWTRITVRGRGAHVLGAERAVNAAHKAQVVMEAIKLLEREANERPGRPAEFSELAHPLNYNVGVLQAGDWPSSVPPECTLEVRISAFPGEELDEVAERFRRRLLEETSSDPWLAKNPPQIEFFAFRAQGCTLDPRDPLFATIASSHQQVLGREVEHYVSTATTDARFFSLYFDTPATCYGPVGGNLHAPDEWVDLQSVKETTKVLALVAMEWCGVDEGRE